MRDLSLKTIIWHVIKYITLPLLQDKVPLTVKYLPVALLHIERFMENKSIYHGRLNLQFDFSTEKMLKEKKFIWNSYLLQIPSIDFLEK